MSKEKNIEDNLAPEELDEEQLNQVQGGVFNLGEGAIPAFTTKTISSTDSDSTIKSTSEIDSFGTNSAGSGKQ